MPVVWDDVVFGSVGDFDLMDVGFGLRFHGRMYGWSGCRLAWVSAAVLAIDCGAGLCFWAVRFMAV